MQAWIRALKLGGRMDVARDLGKMMADAWLLETPLVRAPPVRHSDERRAGAEPSGFALAPPARRPRPIVVAVPTAKASIRQRGYDHARLLADETARRLGLRQATRLLERSSPGRDQHELDREARWDNLAGVFRVRAPAPRRVLLIDDVMTSGATAWHAADTLRRAGARRVEVLVAARKP